VAAVREKPSNPRPAGAFWKARPADPARPAAEPPAAAAAALQSIGLGGNAAVLWSGRPLTAAERDAVVALARPLVEFLSSRVVSGAEPADDTVHPPSRPQGKGTRS
jgi:hypothetical protein